jgi:hypothetical protein
MDRISPIAQSAIAERRLNTTNGRSDTMSGNRSPQSDDCGPETIVRLVPSESRTISARKAAQAANTSKM